jgi:hypothetical protein
MSHRRALDMILTNARSLSLVAGLWALIGAGCVAEPPSVELGPQGSARVVFVLPRSVPADTVTRVTASADNEGSEPVGVELEGSGAVWQGLLGSLPAEAPYSFRAEAFDAAGAVRFEAEVGSEALVTRRSALIILVGFDPGLPTASGSKAPFIRSLVASSATVTPRGRVSLRAVVDDPEPGASRTYEWEADGGTFDDPGSLTPVWTAPAASGQLGLRLKVRDASFETSLSFTIDVGFLVGPDSAGPVVFNRQSLGWRLVPRSTTTVGVGQEVTVEAQGMDPDGDALTFSWAASCPGGLQGEATSTVSFTPGALPETTPCDNCLLSVRIEDGFGGLTELDQGLCVRERRPPTLVSASPADRTAAPGELLKLSVAAEDPSGGPLMFEWKANTGTLGVPVTTGNSSELIWTALSCMPAGVTPMIEVRVANSAGLSIRLFSEVTWNGPVCGHPPCAVQLVEELLTVQEDCTTDTPVFIPEGMTLDGSGRTLVAVDPAGRHFVGAILRNRGTEAHVRNLKLRAQGLLKEGPCDGGDDRLRGILLLGASGSVVDSDVSGIRRNQPVEGSPEGVPRGCQEGSAIEVRNRDATVQRQVELLRNVVSEYQKGGIVVIGRVEATISGNTMTGGGPVGHIARNGIQLSDGATGTVTGNQVSGHSYTGGDVATGILVTGGPMYGLALVRGATIQGNTLTGNDIGIYLAQGEADGSGPATPTRIQVLENTLANEALTNGIPYQAGIADNGGGNILHSNTISGMGYDPSTEPGSTFDVDVVAGAVSQVEFLTPTRAVAVGACSGKVVVQGQDAQGNRVQPAPTTFTLTASGDAATGLTFHADAACAGAAISTVELSTPEATGTFYFKATQPGAVRLTVSNGSLGDSQDQSVLAP